MKRSISISNFGWRQIASIIITTLLVASILFLAFTPLNIQTNMLSLLPKERNSMAKELAFQHVSREAAQKIIVLLGASNQQESYEIANNFFQNISNLPFIEQNNFHINFADKSKVFELLAQYKYQLLSPDYQNLLSQKNGAQIAQNAQQNLISPFAFHTSKLSEDPFLLSENFITNLPLPRSALFPYKDVLMAKYDEKYYSFLALTLDANKVFATKEVDEVVSKIKTAKRLTEQKFPAAEIILSGVPIHSHAGSQQGLKEANSIGWVSLFGVLLLIYVTFRSLKPFLFASASIVIGFIVAFATTHLVFGEIHILTIIFGTSLVGVSDDYSLHFFCEYLNRKKASKESGMKVLQHIFPAISLGLITSIFGYASLLLTPFPGLQQIAFFSTVGFTTSFLIVVLFFPKFYLPKKLNYQPILLNLADKFLLLFQRIFSPKIAYFFLTFLAVASAFGISKVKVSDDIRLLYSSPQKLIDNEILTRKILQHDRAVSFFLIEAESEQKLLEKEENFTTKLRTLVEAKSLKSFQSITQIIPSQKQQEQSFELVKNELFEPHLKQQAKELGINQKQIEQLQISLNSPKKFLTVEEVLQSDAAEIARQLWIGKMADGNYASIITLEAVKDNAVLKNLSNESKKIYLVNKVEDISNIFQQYRQIALLLLLAVNVAIAILLIWRHGFKKALFVFLPPAIAACLTMAIFGFSNHSINLFDILALFLVMGVGVDYAIFYAEDKKTLPTTSLAVVLSSWTTLLSFGLLALSSFNAIHSIGLTILLGVLLSYLLSPFSSLIHHKR